MNKSIDFDNVLNYVHAAYIVYKKYINDMNNQPVELIATFMIEFNSLVKMLDVLGIDTKKQLDYWDSVDNKSN